METQKRGRQSFVLDNPPVITTWSSVAGKKEAEGPLAHTFDIKCRDAYFGQTTWEQAEKQMQQQALKKLAEKANMTLQDFDIVFSGDLLNQCIGSSFTLRNMGVPHLGLYGACSTMSESLLMASMAVGGGFAEKAVAMTSSHLPPLSGSTAFLWGTVGRERPPRSGRLPVPVPRLFVTAVKALRSQPAPSEQSLIWASRTPTIWAPPWRPPLMPRYGHTSMI